MFRTMAEAWARIAIGRAFARVDGFSDELDEKGSSSALQINDGDARSDVNTEAEIPRNRLLAVWIRKRGMIERNKRIRESEVRRHGKT